MRFLLGEDSHRAESFGGSPGAFVVPRRRSGSVFRERRWGVETV